MAKKKNIFQRYFENFGLKQICDILMVIALVLVIVGWILWNTAEIILTIAFAIFVLTSVLSIIRCISIIRKEPNKRSPERRAAIVNIVIMLIFFAVALFALIWGLTVGYALPNVN